MNRQEKAQIIEQLHEKAARASIAVVTDFKGMGVEEMTLLRVKLREAGVDYQVVKNTLARLALKETSHDVLNERLKENCAVALGYDDPVALAKALADFAKTSKKLQLRYGSLEGKFLDEEGVKQLATLPSKPELLAKLAEGNVHTRDELADLATDELVEMTGQTEDEATALIMKAREHWFDQDQA